MQVSVEATDIEKGQRQLEKRGPRSETCPVACAIQRLFPEIRITVGLITVRIGEVRYALPREARDAIWNFDDRKRQDPFSFEMDLA